MTPDKLDELETLLAKATPWPIAVADDCSARVTSVFGGVVYGIGKIYSDDDREAVVALYNAASDLIATIRAQAEEIAMLTRVIKGLIGPKTGEKLITEMKSEEVQP